MGTDIHGVFQRLSAETGKWYDVPSDYEEQRHYQLFAVLAGVRNGTGFAGVRTGDAVTPIAEPRGLPEDFSLLDGEYHPTEREIRQPDDPTEIWMGDHSHSWLSGEEMVSWCERAPSVMHVGLISRSHYEEWGGVSAPSLYCGGISGPRVVCIEDTPWDRRAHPDWTHIRCAWRVDIKEELKYFFDEVVRLIKEYGKIRFVFGFDS